MQYPMYALYLSGSGRVDMLTRQVALAWAAVAKRSVGLNWHTPCIWYSYVRGSVVAQALLLPIRRRIKKEKKKSYIQYALYTTL